MTRGRNGCRDAARDTDRPWTTDRRGEHAQAGVALSSNASSSHTAPMT